MTRTAARGLTRSACTASLFFGPCTAMMPGKAIGTGRREPFRGSGGGSYAPRATVLHSRSRLFFLGRRQRCYSHGTAPRLGRAARLPLDAGDRSPPGRVFRSEEHTSELQSRLHL